jgi:hypothetical protein
LDIYVAGDRARFRAVLAAYLAENRLRLPKLYKRICAAQHVTEDAGFSFKTFQRFMAGTHQTGDEAVAICARFVNNLPKRLEAFTMLGEALYALYTIPLPFDLRGIYELRSDDRTTSMAIGIPEIIHTDGFLKATFALVTEKHTAPSHRLHDGVLISTADGEYLILLKDRMTRNPRYIAIRGSTAFVYDHARSFEQKIHNYAAEFKRVGDPDYD